MRNVTVERKWGPGAQAQTLMAAEEMGSLSVSMDNVGIGTNTPGELPIDLMHPRLEVIGYASFNGLRVGRDGVNDILSEHQDGLTLTAKGSDDNENEVWYGGIKFRTGEGKHVRMRITPDGRIGIGVEKPAQGVKLTVAGHLLVQAPEGFGTQEDPWDEAYLYLGNKGHFVKAVRDVGLRLSTWGAEDAVAVRQGTGNVGIGVTEPQEKLEVRGNIQIDPPDGWDAEGKEAKLCLGDRENFIRGVYGHGVGIGAWRAGDAITIKQVTGNIGIGKTEPEVRLDVNGEIQAHDILLKNADCAEEFAVENANSVEPGSVMVMNENDTLEPCGKAYDKRVVGVVSGAGSYSPGIVLDRQPGSADRLPIALMGKIFCKADAGNGPIEVGDLLTTSSTPGHAMKASDPLQAFGTIVGKALGSLADGRGLVPVLVTLQ